MVPEGLTITDLFFPKSCIECTCTVKSNSEEAKGHCTPLQEYCIFGVSSSTDFDALLHTDGFMSMQTQR